MKRPNLLRLLLAFLVAVPALLLAAFFGFVGYMKAFAPVALLEQHHAWTTALPVWLGRAVGFSELACAAGLVAAIAWRSKMVWAVPIAMVLLLNQGVAAIVHLARGETGALPQNGVLASLLILLWIGARARRARPAGGAA